MFEQQRNMKIPSDLIPHCPKCGGPLFPNLRGGSWFVQDEGWHAAAERYQAFIDAHKEEKVVYLDLGTGNNTPIIIKIPFMQMAMGNRDATYASINFDQADVPNILGKRGIVINDDIGIVLSELVGEMR